MKMKLNNNFSVTLIGCLTTILLLLVQVHADDSKLVTSLKKGDVEGVKAALKAGADPNESSVTSLGTRGRSAISRAAILPITLSTGEEVCTQEVKNITLEILKLLFDKGAKMQKQDSDILHGPIIKGCNEIVKFLIDKGADVNGKDLGGNTPLYLSYVYDHPKTVEILLKHGATPIPQLEFVQSAFVHAAFKGNISKMEKFLQQGAKVNGVDHYGRTALIEAIKMGEEKALKWLLTKKADSNLSAVSLGPIKRPPLAEAVCPNLWSGDRIIELLLQHGARVSAIDPTFKRTPLHEAVLCHNKSAVKILIDAGARVMPRDAEGKTPLDYAEDGQIIKLLKAAGAVE